MASRSETPSQSSLAPAAGRDPGLSPSSAIIEGYLRYTSRKLLFLISMVLALIVISLVTIRLGDSNLSYGQIVNILLNRGNTWYDTVVWDIRLPKIAAAILAGFALGLAGAVMQGILRNPLASPYTLGISNAAAFGASLGILLLSGGVIIGQTAAYPLINDPAIVTISAFAFAMLATGVVVVLVRYTSSSPETIVLAGLAMSSIFAAALAFIQFIANDVALSSIVYWQFGSLDKVTWSNLLLIFIVTAFASIYFYYKRWDYNAMEAGEDIARGLGTNISRTRFAGLVMSAILTAVVVSFMGIIGFIGLLAPHVVKRLIGNDYRYLLVGSMLVGAIVMLVANMIAHFAFSVVVPVGIITSAIGGPLFIYILIRGYKKDAAS
jgi:iron complex transport system permease protein